MHHEEARLGYEPLVGIITISESRYTSYIRGQEYNDPSGDIAQNILKELGLTKVKRVLVGDKAWMIKNAIDKLITEGCEIIILIGGTGLSKGDVTTEVLNYILDRKLETYSIIYSNLSFEEIGSRVLSSRPLAGFYRDALIISSPGSPKAVELILKNVLKREYIHLLWLNKFTRI